VYTKLKQILRTNIIEIENLKAPSSYDLPLLKNGNRINNKFVKYLDMSSVDILGKHKDKFMRYCVVVNALIDTNGKLEIVELEVDSGLSEKDIREFLVSQTFEVSYLPKELEKWRFHEYFFLRPRSKIQARKERKKEILEEQKAFLKRLTQDTINGFYIPKDLRDSFVQLDSLLKEKDVKVMALLPERKDMIRYHHGLGTFLRNNWGLWGGSRLQKYFNERGVYHPDNISGIILKYYHDWLNGRTETWKEWEDENKIKSD
jgi:hypothetical protein